MVPTASHAISLLTEGAPVSDVEAGVWTKIMKKTVQMKIKVTNATVKVLTLRKLCDKGIGTTTVEEFVRREVNSENRREQVRVVKKIMMTKIVDAKREEEKARNDFQNIMKYLLKRWGQNVNIMARMKTIMQMEVRRTWEERKKAMKKKIDFLEKKWKRKRQHPNEEEWQGIRYGDQYLSQRRRQDCNEFTHVPLVYGDAQLTEAQKTVLALPSKF